MVFGQRVGRPVSLALLPILLFSLTFALQGYDPLPYLIYGAPLVLLGAVSWVLYQLRTHVVEIRILGEGLAQVWTIWDVLRTETRPDEPVVHLRTTGAYMTASIGEMVYDLKKSEWPAHPQLAQALHQAVIYNQTL